MQRLKRVKPDYKDGRTKQSFKDETDINKILIRAQKTGTISHLAKYEGTYGDFAEYDFFGNLVMLTRGREIFDELPSEIRNEFANSPADFFQYVNDPENVDRLNELLPGLAAPGRQNIDVSGKDLADGRIEAAEGDADKKVKKDDVDTESDKSTKKPDGETTEGKPPKKEDS